AERTMTTLIRGETPVTAGKGPVVDSQFDVDGITYVKPAPPMRAKSEFYVRGRPRKGGYDGTNLPPVALTFPDMSRSEWRKFHEEFPSDPVLCGSYQEWRKHRQHGIE